MSDKQELNTSSEKKIHINDIEIPELVSNTYDGEKVDSVTILNDNPELIASTENIANAKDNDENKKQ